MIWLAAGAILFVGIHLLISGTRLRAQLAGRLGERAYMGLFSLLSAGALTWMIVAFARYNTPVPTALMQQRWLAAAGVLVAFVFVVLGLLTPGPTAVGGDAVLDSPEPARGIHRITRHPFLWGVALWAAVHLVFNPQPAGLWFFGAFLVLALIGPPSIDAKRAAKFGEKWARYAAVTSNVPFLAIAQGRNRLVPRELGVIKLAIALAAFAGFLLLHPMLFGVHPV